VIQYEIEARPFVDADIEAAFDWYEAEQAGLGVEFLAELRLRIVEFSVARLSIKNFVPAFGVRLQSDSHTQSISRSRSRLL